MNQLTLDQAIDLANRHYSANQLDQAAAIYRQILSQQANLPEAHNGLGNCLRATGFFTEAIACYRRAVELAPGYLPAWINLGSTLQIAARFDKSMDAYRHARTIAPDDPTLLFNIGHLQLQRGGDLLDGLRKLEPLREIRRAANPIIQSHPKWEGGDPRGLRILVYAEQGCGDTIQFARYLSFISERAEHVTIVTQPELTRLIQQSFPRAEVLAYRDDLRPQVGASQALLSLPLTLSEAGNVIPAIVPYLNVDPAIAARWRARMPRDRLKIGIAWSGNTNFPLNSLRSLPLAALEGLAKISGTSFCSLQKGPAADQWKSSPAFSQMPDWTGELTDFADTAALIDALDLIISVDTAIPHLAGALGKPVWTLLHASPDWRWLLDRTDSPWYPSMRLFRQTSLGNWSRPVAEIVHTLRSFRINAT